MIAWIRKRLGYHVCETFTRWQVKEARYGRSPMSSYEFTTALKDPEGKVHFTRRWQERECVDCGRVWERDLEQ